MNTSNQAEHYKARRKRAYELLGNKCAKCNAVTTLEIDHIDRSTKGYKQNTAWLRLKEEKFLAELSKCQLLCLSCHAAKTKLEFTGVAKLANAEALKASGENLEGANPFPGTKLSKKEIRKYITRRYRAKRRLLTGKDR